MFELEGVQEDPGLTERERQILELVADGLSSKQVAQRVGIAPRTVDRHIENLRHKLRARNKSHLIAKAFAYGTLMCEEEANDGLTLQAASRARLVVRH